MAHEWLRVVACCRGAIHVAVALGSLWIFGCGLSCGAETQVFDMSEFLENNRLTRSVFIVVDRPLFPVGAIVGEHYRMGLSAEVVKEIGPIELDVQVEGTLEHRYVTIVVPKNVSGNITMCWVLRQDGRLCVGSDANGVVIAVSDRQSTFNGGR